MIQKKQPTQEDYSTIFYWNLALSFILYAILFFTSPLIAGFYNLAMLSPVLRVQGLVLILNSLSIIQLNRLRKQLKFKKISIVSLTSATISVGVTIYLAYNGWGVWALVAQQLLMSFFNTVLFWIVAGWMPSFIFSYQSFKELFSFGGFILLSNLLNTLGNNIQGILIGKFFSSHTMGLYSQARKLEEVASTSLSNVVDQVSFPVLAEVKNDKTRLINVLRKLITSIAFFSFPIMLLLIAIAKPVIVLLYSSKWIECVPYFQILCVAGIAISLQNINYYAVAAIGKSKELFFWTVIKRIISLGLIIIGFFIYGIWGLLGGMVLAAYIMYAINAVLVSVNVGYKFTSQVKDLMPILIISLISFALTILSTYFNLSSLLAILLASFIFTISYLMLSHIFMRERVQGLKTLLLDMINK